MTMIKSNDLAVWCGDPLWTGEPDTGPGQRKVRSQSQCDVSLSANRRGGKGWGGGRDTEKHQTSKLWLHTNQLFGQGEIIYCQTITVLKVPVSWWLHPSLSPSLPTSEGMTVCSVWNKIAAAPVPEKSSHVWFISRHQVVFD